MLAVYAGVTCYNEPYLWGACLSVPSNLNIEEWAAICVTKEDAATLQFSQFVFPAGLEGPVPTPTFHNHPSAVHHSSDSAAYIWKDLKEGAMLVEFGIIRGKS